MCIPLYIPYIALLALASPHAGSPTGVLISIASIAAMMTIFSIAVGGLLASIYMSIKSNWRLLLTVFLLSDILQRFSTAYYPPASLSYIPSILREIIEINPISLSADISRILLGVLDGEITIKIAILAIELTIISIPLSMVLARKLEF